MLLSKKISLLFPYPVYTSEPPMPRKKQPTQETWVVLTPPDMECLLSKPKAADSSTPTPKKLLCFLDPHPTFSRKNTSGWVRHSADLDEASALLADGRFAGHLFLDEKRKPSVAGKIALLVREWVSATPAIFIAAIIK